MRQLDYTQKYKKQVIKKKKTIEFLLKLWKGKLEAIWKNTKEKKTHKGKGLTTSPSNEHISEHQKETKNRDK